MISIAVNIAAIVLGSLIGLTVKNSLRKSITDAVMVGIGLFTVYLGITGLKSEVSSIVYLLAIIFGGAIGTSLKIDEGVDRFADRVQTRLIRDGEESRFAEGFTGFFIMSCVGAYTLVASFNAGLGDGTMMYTKAVMDFIVSMAMASTLGVGVLFAGIPIILFECILALLASSLSAALSDSVIEAFSCMGAILTLAIGTNVAGVTKFKVVNYTPSLIFAPLLAALFELL